MKRTPLFDAHQKLGAKLIEFGGWEMPVYYSSIIDEHQAVRKAAGLFDISHMGEIEVKGPDAAAFLDRILTNDIRKLKTGQGQYTLLCNENGGVIDDLYAFCLEEENYLLIVNASRIEADSEWITKQQSGAVVVKNISEGFGAVALQGPAAASFIDKTFPDASNLRKNEIASINEALVSRTGYTGEDGFEIVAPANEINVIWESLLNTGREHGLKPAGLGARDTLRTEACYPLYGHELDEQTTPIEAGLGFFVALDKGDFIGRAVLAEQKKAGVEKKLVAFKMSGRSAPPRHGYPLLKCDQPSDRIGSVTSGTQSPSLNAGIGLGYIPPALSAVNTNIAVEIRGQPAAAVVVKKPFYRNA